MTSFMLQILIRKGVISTYSKPSSSGSFYSGSLGMLKLNIALRTDQLVEPAYCHHVMNGQRDPSWCKLVVVWQHPEDPNLEVVSLSFVDPIYPPQLRMQGCQPLMAPYIPEDSDQDNDNEDDDNLELEKSYSSILCPKPRMILAASTEGDVEEGEFDCAALLSLNPNLVVANNGVTFNTNLFVYNHLDVNILSSNLHTQFGYTPSSTFSSTRRPWEQLSSPSTPTKRKSFYSKKDSEIHKLTDSVLVESILDAAEEGCYHDNPISHPSFNVQEPETMPTILGVAMSEWLSASSMASLVLVFLSSASSESAFSSVSLACATSPFMDISATLSIPWCAETPLPWNLQFPAHTPCFHNASATNPIGVGWLTWNSPAGVTHDVWVQLITSWCSFKAHMDHLLEGPCAAFGDEAVGVFPPATEESAAA
ncbi:hypothetical protein BT96DRAFT_947464 [Gymnopus androsaceus JB14]|uniref:Uncharacterized protein n=1 Tax=Gymnopus androsaceus JB14 TaxID=1447944 RepID=A0A6A4GSI4_9AGAR|nr:hypothetical protein BT96DRAFT_947464 [Gymnopus androsaceus JB14]